MQQKFENTKITVEFDEAGNRQQLNSGDSLKALFGKIKKWFSDLNPVAFSGSYNDLSDKPQIAESLDGYDSINEVVRIGNNCTDKELCVSNPWYKVAELNITNGNYDENMTLLISSEFYNPSYSYWGIMRVEVRLADNGVFEKGKLEWGFISDKFDDNEWVLLYDNNAPCKCEIWTKLPERWRNVSVRKLSSSNTRNFNSKWKLLNSYFTATAGSESYTEGMTAINQTYLNNTIDGDIYYKGTKATHPMIKWIDNEIDGYGNGLSIGGGGLTVIGGGESSDIVSKQFDSEHMEDGKTHGGEEKMIIVNDNAIDFYTDCQNGFDAAKHIYMSNGNVIANQFIGNATSASKLQTSRNISLGGNFVGDANFDGSGNITINARNEYAWCMSENTINYPYHRFAYIEPNSRKEYLDNGNIFIINRPYCDAKGGIGIFQVFIRKNHENNSLFDIRWIVRDKNIPINCIKMCCNNDTNNTTVDLFYQFTRGYEGCVISRISDWGRRRVDEIPLKLCHSHERGNTTATDKKDSYESYKSLDDAATELGRTFTDILTPKSNSIVEESRSATKINPEYIPVNSDLNEYKNDSGFYYSHLNTEAVTLKNCPTNIAFYMRICKYDAICTQEIIEYAPTNPKKYIRNHHAGKWGQWYRVYTTADKPTASEIGCIPRYIVSTATNFDNVKDEGVYCINVSGCTGLPVSNLGTVFVNPYGTKYQIFIVDQTKNIYKRSYKSSDGKWGEWINLFDTASASNVDWSNVQNKPTIPTKTSQLTNDSNFVTTSGNVASATKLATARTITIGNKSNTFNGTGNISFNLSDIGALYDNCSKSGAITINGIKFYTVMNGSTFKVVDAENICCSNGYLKVINSTGGYNGIYASQFSTQSSRRVKTNITPMTEDEARKILDVGVVGYDYINGAKDQYGMIAEDVYGIIPSIVSGDIDCDDDDTEAVSRIGIDYSKAVPYLIKMVQMMEVEIRELKKELKMRDKIDE